MYSSIKQSLVLAENKENCKQSSWQASSWDLSSQDKLDKGFLRGQIVNMQKLGNTVPKSHLSSFIPSSLYKCVVVSTMNENNVLS